MPRSAKRRTTSKQKRQPMSMEEGYEQRGISPTLAARRAFAAIGMEAGAGKKSSSGRGRKTSTTTSTTARKRAAAKRSPAARSRAAKKAARTRGRKSSSSR
jgi:hypothetical protein